MAVTGLLMVLYLLAHMYGNLHVFAGQVAFDDYAHAFRTLGEPFLPFSGALWIIRVTLLAAVVLHAYSAATLWRRARGAKGGRGGWRYESTKARGGVQRTYASFTMRWGGVTLGLIESLAVVSVSSGYKDVIAMTLLIVIMIFMPNGILGRGSRKGG